jgi:hypothetical protein
MSLSVSFSLVVHALWVWLVGKEVFTFKKILPGRLSQFQCDKGIEDRVSSKI